MKKIFRFALTLISNFKIKCFFSDLWPSHSISTLFCFKSCSDLLWADWDLKSFQSCLNSNKELLDIDHCEIVFLKPMNCIFLGGWGAESFVSDLILQICLGWTTGTTLGLRLFWLQNINKTSIFFNLPNKRKKKEILNKIC